MLASEQEKLSKLQVLAKDKYQIELGKLDVYLPRGKEWHKKQQELEKKLRSECRSELSDVRAKARTIEEKHAGKKRQLEAMQEKMDALKSRLRRRAADSQKLIDKAVELGHYDSSKEI